MKLTIKTAKGSLTGSPVELAERLAEIQPHYAVDRHRSASTSDAAGWLAGINAAIVASRILAMGCEPS